MKTEINNLDKMNEINFNESLKKIYNLLNVLECEYKEDVDFELKKEILNIIKILEKSQNDLNPFKNIDTSGALITDIVLETYHKQLHKNEHNKFLQIINKLKRLDDINRLILSKNQSSEYETSKFYTIKSYMKIIESLSMSKNSNELLMQSKKLINCVFEDEIDIILENLELNPTFPNSETSSVRSSRFLPSEATTFYSTDDNYESELVENLENDLERRKLRISLIDKLLSDCSRQEEVMLQVSKAIKVCTKTKKMKYSKIHVEAERILIWACQTHKALLNELSKFEYNFLRTNEAENWRFSQIIITELMFNLNNVVNDLEKSLNEWFVVLINYEETVLASQVVKLNNEGVLRIEEEIKLLNLKESFMVNFKIYHLPMPEIQKVGRKAILHKIKQFFKRSAIITPNQNPFGKPSFVLFGVCNFPIANLCELSEMESTSNSYNQSERAFFMNLCSNLSLTGTCKGLLKPYIEHKCVLETSL